ncbi:MAG: PAS domain S-box protein [Chitinispirillaceae bacterium]|nr:PAS domain S-box protein [Chitinispirillaceae bacterium]
MIGYPSIIAALTGSIPMSLLFTDTPLHWFEVVTGLLAVVCLLFVVLFWRKNRALINEIRTREQAQRELVEAKNRYKTLVDNLPQSIFWKDTGSHYISVNKTYAQLLRHRTADMIGMTDHDLFPLPLADKFRDDDRRIMESGEAEELVDRITFNNKPRWIHTVKTPLIDEDGAVQGILGIFWDITDQKKAHDDLRQTQRFNESVMGSTLDVVYIYDITADAVVYINAHLSELLGYADAEVKAMGSVFHERLLHPDDRWMIADLLARCNSHRDGVVETIELRMRDAVGRWLWFQARYAVFKRNSEGKVDQLIGTLHDITERVTVENALKIAFDRAQRYLDIVETIIIALDRDGRITLINRKGTQVLGRDSTELVGKNWFDTCLSNDDRMETAQFFGVLIGGDAMAVEYHENRIRTADGSLRVIAWHNNVLRDDQGTVIGTLSAGEDITERKKAEEFVKAEKLRQSTLLNLSQLPGLTVVNTMDYALDTAMVLTKSSIGYLYFYNKETRLFTLCSWSKDAMKQCSIVEKQTTYELDKTGLWGEAVRQRKPVITNDYHAENRWKRGLPEGHVPLSSHVNVPVFDGGDIVAVIGVGNKPEPYDETDVRHLQLLMDTVWKIKKRIEMEEQIRLLNEDLERKVEERTAEVFNAHEEVTRFFTLTLDLLCIADVEGRFIRCNKAWEGMLGYSVDDLEGKRFLDFVHPDDIPMTMKQIERLREGGEVVDFTNRYRCFDGSYRWIEWRSNAIGQLIYAAARDITAQKEYQQQLIEARDEADQANRAKSQFLATISHEIRTPLNAVIGYSEMLSGMPLGENERSFADSIALAGRNLLRLINDILDLSKIEANMMSINYGAVNLVGILEEIEQIFSFKLNAKGLRYSIKIDPHLPRYLVLDEVRIRQVLLNLVGNAVKFTEKGSVSVSVSCVDSKAGLSKVDLTIAVEDTGIGIDRQLYDEIFAAFRQLRPTKYGGSGLGLSISRKLLELMNGTIRVESVPGKGSEFSVHLPEVAVASIVPSSDGIQWSEDEPENVPPAYSVLIADDIPSNREMIGTLLTDAGLTVHYAQNGSVAVDLAREFIPGCIIMDMLMPILDGAAAARMLRKIPETASIPIIAMTTLVEQMQDEPEEQGLFNGRLCKPVSASDLFDELVKYLPGMRRIQSLAVESSADLFSGTGGDRVELPQEYVEKAGELLGAVKMEDIRVFARQITAFGKEHRLKALRGIGKKLAGYADRFDIAAVRGLLRSLVGCAENVRK